LSLPSDGFLFENEGMRFRSALVLFCCFLAAGPPFSSARQIKSRASAIDSSYSSALAAANRFLHAWQTQDHEAGILMLTDAVRQQASSDKLQEFFSPDERAAYEIQRGRRLNAGEYVFPVVLFGTAQNSRPRACRLVIMRTGKDEWAVNRLP